MRQLPALDSINLGGAPLLSFARVPETSASWQPHVHNVDELIYSPRGVLVAKTATQCWVLPPLRALWLPAGTVHEVQCGAGMAIVCLYLAGGYVGLERRPELMEVSPLLRQLIVRASEWAVPGTDPKHLRITEVIRDEMEVARPVPALDMIVPNDPRARRVAAALANLEQAEDSLDAICHEAGASRRTIERLFRQDTGLSLGQWRTRARVQRSLDMLERGEKMTFTAAEVGYSTPSAFIASFKRLLGTTPGQYLRSKS